MLPIIKKNIFYNLLNKKKVYYFFLFILLFCLIPLDSFASIAGGDLPYEQWLTKLRTSVTGPIAFSLSIIGIVIAGGALIFGGDLNGFFRSLIFLTLVIGIIIGANNLMTGYFGGTGAEITIINQYLTSVIA
jgi:type IV secretion system protein TrbC